MCATNPMSQRTKSTLMIAQRIPAMGSSKFEDALANNELPSERPIALTPIWRTGTEARGVRAAKRPAMFRRRSVSRKRAVARIALAAVFSSTSACGVVDAQTASGRFGAVATDSRPASRVGLAVLERGGNAVDAAIAIGYALAVTYPSAGNIGGGGFMVIRRPDGSTRFVDFRERAPAAATRTMYDDAKGRPIAEKSTVGALAAGVPGTVAGFEAARRDATLSRHDLMAPAIALAEGGFAFDAPDAEEFARHAALLSRFPATAAIFLPGGRAPRPGSVLRQPALARTLRAVDRYGANGFYSGEVARRFVAGVRAGGGIMTMADLASYRAVDRPTLRCSAGGLEIVSVPPPSSGGTTLCETLGILALMPREPRRGVRDVHDEVEAERRAFADRNTFLGDPDASPGVTASVRRLLSREHLVAERATIDPSRATPSRAIAPKLALHEGTNTTHYAVVDRHGEAVSVTYTLNSTFGSGAMAGDTGVLLNDEMDDFATAPGFPNQFGLIDGKRNEVGPGKRPLSSMSPTIVVRDGALALVAGAAGGSHIITTTLDLVRDVLWYHRSLAFAMGAPRLHHQWYPDDVAIDAGTLAPDVRAALERDGYRFEIDPFGSAANAIAIDPATHRIEAVHDDRRKTGVALAY